jgi:hypothetical protein
MHTDVLDGKSWAIQQGYADARRVCIFGGSYGGYERLVGVSFNPDEFICGVDSFGPSNLVTLIQSIPPYWAPVKSLFNRRVGNVETEPDFLKSRSPLFKANQIKVPLLVVQGANDVRVKQAESDQIVAGGAQERQRGAVPSVPQREAWIRYASEQPEVLRRGGTLLGQVFGRPQRTTFGGREIG